MRFADLAREFSPSRMPERPSPMLCTLVDARGVALRSGHNCAQPVLDWLGTSSVARLSPAFYNTSAEIDYAAQQIDRAAQMLRAARSRK